VLTLVIGTVLLGATLRAPAGSEWFSGLALLVAATWVIGAVSSGPIPIPSAPSGVWRAAVVPAVLVGVAAFVGFFLAFLVAQRVALASAALDSVLGKADAGPLALVLFVAIANGVAEELFFRGAVHEAFGPRRPALGATVVYVAVTAATGNVTLVVAAVVMGTIFSLERLSTRGVLASVFTHVTWSVLMLLALPR
jgi:membrane protease YdiL (CAAX protease family)